MDFYCVRFCSNIIQCPCNKITVSIPPLSKLLLAFKSMLLRRLLRRHYCPGVDRRTLDLAVAGSIPVTGEILLQSSQSVTLQQTVLWEMIYYLRPWVSFSFFFYKFWVKCVEVLTLKFPSMLSNDTMKFWTQGSFASKLVKSSWN